MVHKYPRRVVNDGNDHLRHYTRFLEDAAAGSVCLFFDTTVFVANYNDDDDCCEAASLLVR